MSLERYLKTEDGYRKYVELLESTPSAKRKTLLDSAKTENLLFAETAEKYILTVDRITHLPEMELTEVLGASSLTPAAVGVVLCSVEDTALREKLVAGLPRALSAKVILGMKENPTPEPSEVGSARLKFIKAARELEKQGKLDSVQIPRFTPGFFTSPKAA
jgi:flagellar motor switch protein FliG